MSDASDDQRAAGELAALAGANYDRIHWCFDSPHDARAVVCVLSVVP
jgi:hypothetical protein